MYPGEVLTRVPGEDVHRSIVCSGRKLKNHYCGRCGMRWMLTPGIGQSEDGGYADRDTRAPITGKVLSAKERTLYVGRWRYIIPSTGAGNESTPAWLVW